MGIYMKIKLSIGLLYFLQTLTCIQGEYTYRYKGCFFYSSTTYSTSTFNHNNYIGYCVNYCRRYKYVYAGLHASYYCHCGTSTSTYNQHSSYSSCYNPCPGNQSQICGGTYDVSVYEIVDASATSATTTVTTTTTPTTTKTTTTKTTTTTPTTTKTTTTTPTTTTTSTTKTTTTTTTTTAATATPVTTTTTTTANTQTDNANMADIDQKISSNVTKYIGIGVGAVVVCAIIVLVVVLVVRRRQNTDMCYWLSGRSSCNNLSNSTDLLEPRSVSLTTSEPSDHEPSTCSITAATATHHVTPSGDVYAVVNKVKPSQVAADTAEPEHSVANEQREDNIYINSTQASVTYYNCTTQASYNTNQSAVNNCEDKQVYSLAEPIIDDLVVVDNQLYEAP